MSFGRKGIVPGKAAPTVTRTAAPVPSHDDGMAARREAFLASERARNGGSSESAAGSPDTKSDHLSGLRNGPRPATRRDEGVGHSWSPMPEKDIRAAGLRTKPRQNFIFGDPNGRSLTLAYLFWFVAGQGSLHRFYCGQKHTALMQIGLLIGSILVAFIFAPLGLIGLLAWVVWLFADLFLMPGMLRRFKAEHRTDYVGVFA